MFDLVMVAVGGGEVVLWLVVDVVDEWMNGMVVRLVR